MSADSMKRRESTLVPAWMLKVQEDQAAKRETDLKNQLANLSKTGKALETDGTKKPDAAEVKVYDEKVKNLADKLGVEPDELKDAIKSLVPDAPTLPPDLAEKLKEIDTLKSERAIAVEEAKFSADFDTQILPLIKKEYGDDVPPETILKLKENLKAMAYEPDYAKVPYATIYKGTDSFRGVIPDKKKGAENSRGGTVVVTQSTRTTAQNGDIDWADPDLDLSDEQLKKLDAAEFDKYCDIQAKREQTGRSARIAKNEG